jgi:hypothetical protein
MPAVPEAAKEGSFRLSEGSEVDEQAARKTENSSAAMGRHAPRAGRVHAAFKPFPLSNPRAGAASVKHFDRFIQTIPFSLFGNELLRLYKPIPSLGLGTQQAISYILATISPAFAAASIHATLQKVTL